MAEELCTRCKQYPVERIEDWVSHLCPYCNDREIERSNRRREWDHYHPGEPCPNCELEP